MKRKLDKLIAEKKKKHIIFDLDETLGRIILDWDGWMKEITKILQKYDPAFTKQPLHSWAQVQNFYFKKHGKKIRDEIAVFSSHYESTYLQGFEEYTLIPQIKKLSPSSLSLWTSNSRKAVVPLLARLGLTSTFSPIVTRDEVMFLKPHHEGFDLIHEIHKLPLIDYLFIGDSSADRGAAKGAGIDFVHVDDFS